MLHVSHTPLLVCTALCRRWILSGDHYKVISCWGVECRSLTSKKQRPDTEGEWSNRWTGLRKLTLSSFISSSWSFVSCCLFSCYCSNTHTHIHGHTPAMQSQLLLGVDVMLTLMDQLCDQPDLFAVHEGFIFVVDPQPPRWCDSTRRVMLWWQRWRLHVSAVVLIFL